MAGPINKIDLSLVKGKMSLLFFNKVIDSAAGN